MTKRTFALLAVVALLAGTGAAFAGDSWTGEVLEMGCYLKNGSKGEAHAGCAKSCLSKPDGKIGLLIGEEVKNLEPADDATRAALIDLAGKQATVTGSVDGDTITVTGASAG